MRAALRRVPSLQLRTRGRNGGAEDPPVRCRFRLQLPSLVDASTSVFLVAWSVLALLLVWLALSRQRMKTASIILAVAALLIGALGLSMGVPVVLALASVPLAAAFAVRAFAPNRVVGGTAG